MSRPAITVISTAFRSPHEKICKASVLIQAGVEATHMWIEASEQTPPKTKIENLYDAIAPLHPDTVCAVVDGDDWIDHKLVLARVVHEHRERGAWVTYGSFAQSDGRPGFAAPYGEKESYRGSDWRLTHLKTFRAGLFQRIRKDDLFFNGSWIDRGADDQAFMFPMAEMAGRDRVHFIPERLYVYSLSTAFESTATNAQIAHLRATSQHVRSLPPYERIEAL